MYMIRVSVYLFIMKWYEPVSVFGARLVFVGRRVSGVVVVCL